jgi:hypothetical protein
MIQDTMQASVLGLINKARWKGVPEIRKVCVRREINIEWTHERERDRKNRTDNWETTRMMQAMIHIMATSWHNAEKKKEGDGRRSNGHTPEEFQEKIAGRN